MKPSKIRIYGKELNTWKAYDENGVERITQIELAYSDYEIATGKLVSTGSEDFSRERARNLQKYEVWTWDGEKRNKGGYRWFELQCYCKINRSETAPKDLKTYLSKKYGAEMVRLNNWNWS